MTQVSAKTIEATRRKWRLSLGPASTAGIEDYQAQMRTHCQTINRYLADFHKYLGIWIARDRRNADAARSVFGHRRRDEVLAGARPTIAELSELLMAVDLRAEFHEYLIGKTHLSYEMKPTMPSPRNDRGDTSTGGMYAKMAEFVVIVLGTYIVLHNLMFVTKRRPPGVNSIDKWLRPFPLEKREGGNLHGGEPQGTIACQKNKRRSQSVRER